MRGVAAVKVNIGTPATRWRKLPGRRAGARRARRRDPVLAGPLADASTDGSPALTAEAAEHRPYGDADLQRWTGSCASGSPNRPSGCGWTARYLASEGAANWGPGASCCSTTRPRTRCGALCRRQRRAGLRRAAAADGHALAAPARRAPQSWPARPLQAAHDSLESTVVARTAELRAAQNDLVHAGKLAALGQMSAGMVHELNQPLTAMRTLSDSAGAARQGPPRRRARQPAAHRRPGRPPGRLTRQLKTFAHKTATAQRVCSRRWCTPHCSSSTPGCVNSALR